MDTRRDFLKRSIQTMTATAVLGGLLVCPAEAKQPNVLFVFPDQMRGQALGCMGDPNVQTPHLDQLARQGVLMRQTLANTPVCCPARACMLTGQYAHRHGLVANDLRLRESRTTLAECFQQAGYDTGFIGKWHLDGGKRMPGFVPPGPRRQGFDFWAANECSHAHFNTQYFRDTPEPIPVKKFEVEAWTDLAIEFLRHKRERPFFLMIAPGPPHDPYKAPPEYEALYKAQDLALRPNWQEGVKGGSRQDLASYYAMIHAIDDQMGRLLKTLDELGLAEDTIVFFTSDHGDMLGSHGMTLKRKPYEESILVPGIFRYPRLGISGRICDSLVTHVDYAPTLLSLCGIPVPDSMQGRDCTATLLGQNGDESDSAFFQIFGPYSNLNVEGGWRAVRTHRYVYARLEKRPWVLFDLHNDPYELRNLIDDPAARPVRIEMEQRLRDWMTRTGDSWKSNWSIPVEDGGRLYKHDTFYSIADYVNWHEKQTGEVLR
ncbi:MAG: sulfatase [bacterium]|jgi:arylsulfatase A-like enzyme|nr:sulfatase [bacterium]